MNLPDLQYQAIQTVEATSIFFIIIPILVMILPLLLMFFPLVALQSPFSRFANLLQHLSKQ